MVATKVIDLMGTPQYGWRTETELLVYGMERTKHFGIHPVACSFNTRTQQRRPLNALLATVPATGASRPGRPDGLGGLRMFYRPCAIAYGGDWLFWFCWEGVDRFIEAIHLTTGKRLLWKVSFDGMGAGNLLALPDRERWVFIADNRNGLSVAVGDVRTTQAVHKYPIGLPRGSGAGWLGAGARLLADVGNNTLLAAGWGGMFHPPEDSPVDFPLFTFVLGKGESSVRAFPVRLPLTGSVVDIAYSSRFGRLAWWEMILSRRHSASSVKTYRLSTCRLDGQDVRILLEVASREREPNQLKWLPTLPCVSYAHHNAVWKILDT